MISRDLSFHIYHATHLIMSSDNACELQELGLYNVIQHQQYYILSETKIATEAGAFQLSYEQFIMIYLE